MGNITKTFKPHMLLYFTKDYKFNIISIIAYITLNSTNDYTTKLHSKCINQQCPYYLKENNKYHNN